MDDATGQSFESSFRIFLRQKKKIPAKIAITATGTTTPIAALAPVDKPDPELGAAECEDVLLARVWVGVEVERSLLCHRISIIGASTSKDEMANSPTLDAELEIPVAVSVTGIVK